MTLCRSTTSGNGLFRRLLGEELCSGNSSSCALDIVPVYGVVLVKNLFFPVPSWFYNIVTTTTVAGGGGGTLL